MWAGCFWLWITIIMGLLWKWQWTFLLYTYREFRVDVSGTDPGTLSSALTIKSVHYYMRFWQKVFFTVWFSACVIGDKKYHKVSSLPPEVLRHILYETYKYDSNLILHEYFFTKDITLIFPTYLNISRLNFHSFGMEIRP